MVLPVALRSLYRHSTLSDYSITLYQNVSRDVRQRNAPSF